MKKINYLDRVYINIPETYAKQKLLFPKLNFNVLIHAVSIANPWGDGETELYNEETHKIFEKRTKNYIVKKTKEYIMGIPERFCPLENMATFVSLRQLKNLIKTYKCEQKRISCYGLIYVYIIYTLLEDKSPHASECKMYLLFLHSIVQDYLELNPEDELAIFLFGCYSPIYKAISKQNTTLDTNQLPAVPRYHPRDEQ